MPNNRNGAEPTTTVQPPHATGRRRLLGFAVLGLAGAGGAGWVLGLFGRTPAVNAGSLEVWKSPSCGCCGNWVQHMREAGFGVTVHDVPDVTPFKRRMGVPEAALSCHTAMVDGYVIEGHVPADVVRRLLAERPPARFQARAKSQADRSSPLML